jgi:hypothetical protein
MKITLCGHQVQIDREDYERILSLKWHPAIRKGRDHIYFRHSVSNKEHLWLHRFILKLPKNEKRIVDHKNCNTLDNRKSNLRLCSTSENKMNTGKQKNNKSGYKGVYKDKNKWRACIKVNRKTINLGTFNAPCIAHISYVIAAKLYFGEYARF